MFSLIKMPMARCSPVPKAPVFHVNSHVRSASATGKQEIKPDVDSGRLLLHLLGQPVKSARNNCKAENEKRVFEPTRRYCRDILQGTASKAIKTIAIVQPGHYHFQASSAVRFFASFMGVPEIPLSFLVLIVGWAASFPSKKSCAS